MRATPWTGLIAVAVLAMAAPLVSAAPAPAPIEGRWAADDAIIVIAPCPDDRGRFCGAVAWHQALKEAVGLVVLKGLIGGPREWRGQSHDGERDYAATVTVNADRLSLRSCLAPGLCETETWRRLPN